MSPETCPRTNPPRIVGAEPATVFLLQYLTGLWFLEVKKSFIYPATKANITPRIQLQIATEGFIACKNTKVLSSPLSPSVSDFY